MSARPRPGQVRRDHTQVDTAGHATSLYLTDKKRTITMNALVSEQLSKLTQHEANTRADQARLARLAQARAERPEAAARTLSWRRLVPAPR